MAEINPAPGATEADFLAQWRARDPVARAAKTPTDMYDSIFGESYVNSGAPLTLASLLSTFPAGIAYKGLYARVSDLFNNGTANGVDEIVRCRYDAANAAYRWVPQRDSFNATVTPASGAVSLLPLVTPPTLRLAGTLTGALTVTPSALNAYIGQKYDIIQNSTLGIFVTTITGLIGSNLTLLGNNTQTLEYTTSGWVKGNP